MTVVCLFTKTDITTPKGQAERLRRQAQSLMAEGLYVEAARLLRSESDNLPGELRFPLLELALQCDIEPHLARVLNHAQA